MPISSVKKRKFSRVSSTVPRATSVSRKGGSSMHDSPGRTNRALWKVLDRTGSNLRFAGPAFSLEPSSPIYPC